MNLGPVVNEEMVFIQQILDLIKEWDMKPDGIGSEYVKILKELLVKKLSPVTECK